MKVKDLRKLLAIYDGDQEVVLGCEHDSYTAHPIRDIRWEAGYGQTTPLTHGGALVILPGIEYINLSEEDRS